MPADYLLLGEPTAYLSTYIFGTSTTYLQNVYTRKPIILVSKPKPKRKNVKVNLRNTTKIDCFELTRLCHQADESLGYNDNMYGYYLQVQRTAQVVHTQTYAYISETRALSLQRSSPNIQGYCCQYTLRSLGKPVTKKLYYVKILIYSMSYCCCNYLSFFLTPTTRLFYL